MDNQTQFVHRTIGRVQRHGVYVITNKALVQDYPGRLTLWSQVTALIAATPCHVSRDGGIPQRCEARATAAAMWATRGPNASGAAGGSSGSKMPPGEVKRTAFGSSSAGGASSPTLVRVDHPWRQVPAHLKEVRASALVGASNSVIDVICRDQKWTNLVI